MPGAARFRVPSWRLVAKFLGKDHRLTLGCAGSFAADLRAMGDLGATRALDQDLLARRRVLGENHPDIPRSASILSTPGHAGERSLAGYRLTLTGSPRWPSSSR